MGRRAVETRTGAMLEAVEAGGDRHDVPRVAVGVVHQGEVIAEEALVRVTGPPQYALQMAGCERGNLAVHVELRRVGRRPCKSFLDEPLHRSHDAAVLAAAAPEPEGPGQLTRTDLGGNPRDPQSRVPAEQQRGARPDDRGPALLDVRVGEVESDPAHGRAGVVDGVNLSVRSRSMPT